MDRIITVSEAKKRIAEIVRTAQDGEVVLVRHSRPVAVVLGVDRYQALLDRIEDLADELSVYESRETDPTMRLSLDKVKAELGLNA